MFYGRYLTNRLAILQETDIIVKSHKRCEARMIRPVLKIPNPILRQKAKPVTQITDEIRRLVDDMRDTMYDEPGVGLAAPQIGVSLRVIVYDNPENEEGFQILINPEIIKSEGQQKGPEACLSIPDISGEVTRALDIQVEGMRLDGKKVSLSLSEFTARIVQHEIDHINGILFIDRVSLADRFSIEKKLRKLRQSAPNI